MPELVWCCGQAVAAMVVRPYGYVVSIELRGKAPVPCAVLCHAMHDVQKQLWATDVPAMHMRHVRILLRFLFSFRRWRGLRTRQFPLPFDDSPCEVVDDVRISSRSG